MKREDILAHIRYHAANGDDGEAIRLFTESGGKVSQSAFREALAAGRAKSKKAAEPTMTKSTTAEMRASDDASLAQAKIDAAAYQGATVAQTKNLRRGDRILTFLGSAKLVGVISYPKAGEHQLVFVPESGPERGREFGRMVPSESWRVLLPAPNANAAAKSPNGKRAPRTTKPSFQVNPEVPAKARARVRTALEAKIGRVADRAAALAKRHAERRNKLVLRARELAKKKASPARTAALAKISATVRELDRTHRAALRELARSGACPPAPRSKCKTSCGLQLEGSYCVGDAPLVLPSPDGAPRRVKARYCLTSADKLTPSHDPITWLPRSDYPPNTQERRYEVDPQEQLKIVRISEQLRPEIIVSGTAGALEGPPVVTRAGIVAGGNGRTMGIQRAYRIGKGDVFRHYLRQNASIFGLRPEDIDAYKEPIVVRVVDVVDGALPRLVRDLNQSTTQSMDATAEAVSAARVMPAAALEAIANGLGEDEDLSEFLASNRSKPLIAALTSSGVITSANRGRLLNHQGLLSEDGRRLVIAQLAAALVQDAATLEDLGQLRQSLARSAPWWLAASATGNYDVRRAFTKAAKDLRDVRRSGMTLATWHRQSGLFSKPHTDGDPLAQAALELMDAVGSKPVIFSKIARRYRQLASALGSAPLLLAADDLDQMTIDAQNSGRLPPPEVALKAAAAAAGAK